jgi:hypothetical protein
MSRGKCQASVSFATIPAIRRLLVSSAFVYSTCRTYSLRIVYDNASNAAIAPGWQRMYRRIQILTIEALLHGAQAQMPPTAQTFKQAPKADSAKPAQPELGLSI